MNGLIKRTAAIAAAVAFVGVGAIASASTTILSNSNIGTLSPGQLGYAGFGPLPGPEAAFVYDSNHLANATLAGVVFSTGTPNASIGDDIIYNDLLVPPNNYLTRMNFAYAIPAATAIPDCDAIITFYENEDGFSTGTTAALTTVIGTGRLHVGSFASNAAVRAFQTGLIGLATLGVHIADVDSDLTSDGISIAFVATGTNNILTGSTITPCLSAGVVSSGDNDTSYFYLDGSNTATGGSLNGIYTGGERVGFGGTNAANNKLWLQIEGDTQLPEPGAVSVMLGGTLLSLRRRRNHA